MRTPPSADKRGRHRLCPRRGKDSWCSSVYQLNVLLLWNFFCGETSGFASLLGCNVEVAGTVNCWSSVPSLWHIVISGLHVTFIVKVIFLLLYLGILKLNVFMHHFVTLILPIPDRKCLKNITHFCNEMSSHHIFLRWSNEAENVN